MDFPPEFAIEQKFVADFLKEVPELVPAWEDYAEAEYEFIPTSAMYDLARGIVTISKQFMSSLEEKEKDSLRRIFAYLEKGMEREEEGPIPNLIRTTMCDWLGRQSEYPDLFQVILYHIGPNLRYWLVTADGRMSFRNKNTPVFIKKDTSKQSSPPKTDTSEWDELEEVYNVSWTYRLYRLHDRFFLSVLCGGVGLYDLTVELTEEEIKNHQNEGEPAIKKLASDISSTPKSYTARKIKIPHTVQMKTALPKEL